MFYKNVVLNVKGVFESNLGYMIGKETKANVSQRIWVFYKNITKI